MLRKTWVVLKNEHCGVCNKHYYYTGYEYAYPWRYDKDNKKLDWYLEIADAFRYPKSPNNAGWYLEKD